MEVVISRLCLICENKQAESIKSWFTLSKQQHLICNEKHLVCQKCWMDIFKTNNQIICPFCRENYTSQYLKIYPFNFVVQLRDLYFIERQSEQFPINNIDDNFRTSVGTNGGVLLYSFTRQRVILSQSLSSPQEDSFVINQDMICNGIFSFGMERLSAYSGIASTISSLL